MSRAEAPDAWTIGPWTIKRAASIHALVAESVGDPDHVHCRACGRTQAVDAARCFAEGWPKCCDYTMTVDCDCEQP